MSNDTVSQIKDRLPVEEVIGSYIDVKRAGANFKAVCPFHNEKTPSFHISPERGTYYCFGCGAKGDIFSFVQEFEGVDFKTALQTLADRAGVEIVYSKKEKEDDDVHRRVMDATVIFFEKMLEKNSEARDYLQSRGITPDDIATWHIGYSPQEWDGLYKMFQTKSVPDKALFDVGLIKKTDSGKIYDTFRDRIMFPIFDSSGRPVAFTGRILHEKKDDASTQAKYINSPETFLFNKSKTLYGYHLAKGAIRKNNFSIIVEGQTDVIAMHRVGYTNAVASSGTALTEDQFTLLKRHSDNVVLALDGDDAGIKASERAWNIALSLGMNIKVAQLPRGLDPADAIAQDPQIVKDAVKKSIHIIEYVSRALLDKKMSAHDIHKEVAEHIVPYLASVKSSIEQSHFIDVVAHMFSINRDAIISEIKNFNPDEPAGRRAEAPTASLPQKKQEPESRLIAIIEWQKQAQTPLIDAHVIERKMTEILDQETITATQTKIKSVLDQVIFRLEEMFTTEKELMSYCEDLLLRISEKSDKHTLTTLREQLRQAEQEADEVKIQELLQTIQNLSKKSS